MSPARRGFVLACLLAAHPGAPRALPLPPAPPARAADAPSVSGGAVDTEETDLARRMKDALASDVGAAEALAQRILESRIATALSQSEDREAALAEVRDWVTANPHDAAYLAIGFARDDAEGSHEFERSLFERVERFFKLNPDRHKGLLGRLMKSAELSRKLASTEDMTDDERKEILKRFFEGASTPDDKVRTGAGGPPGRTPPPPGQDAVPTQALATIYDRLSAANLTGYSPEVQSLQNYLNRMRPPGAPRIEETGKLDFATLRQPYHSMSHDFDRLADTLRWHAAAFRAQALGRRDLAAEKLKDPAVQRELEEAAKAKPLDPSFERRRKALEAGLAALAAFDREAGRMKAPGSISHASLRALSARQHDAARWIAAAALEERLARLRALRGFSTAELAEAVRRVPAEEPVRRAYRERGQRIEARLARAIADAEASLRLYVAGKPPGGPEAERLYAASAEAAKKLPDEIAAYAAAPFRWLELHRPVPGWRRWLDDLVLRLAPGSGRAKAVRRRREEQAALADAFKVIAATP